jgi:UrcA family protein
MSIEVYGSKRVLCAALCAGVLSLLAAGVQANDSVVRQQVVVKYDDLDLSKQQDAKILYSRLEAAANTACGTDGLRDPGIREIHRACYDAALKDAVVRLDQAAVTELYAPLRSQSVMSARR